jgi:[ribosomal protein S18]-alanine N-acetyltransferase
MSVSESTALRFMEFERTHLRDVMTIELEAYPDPWAEGMFLDELRSARSHFYVVYLDDVLIGYGGFWLVLDEAHITSVTIGEDYRGQGYGKQLVVFLLDLARKVGARLATLEVRASNTRARNLYLNTGFRPVGVRKKYYPKSGEDAVVMLKELDE